MYTERPTLMMMALGFAAGLPFLLIFDTLSAWLRDEGLTLEVIGFFSLATLVYSFKFLWAPLIDRRRTPRPGGLVDGDRVIGRISGDAHERAIDGGEQIEGGGRIITRRLGQRVDTDHAGLIDAKVEFPPATPAAATVFRGSPLTCPDDGQTCAVKHQMDALVGRDRSQTARQMLTAPGERRIVRGGEVEAHHPEQRVQEPFGLA